MTNEPRNMVQSEFACGNKLFIDLLATYFKKEHLALTLQMEHQEERKVLTMIDSILRFPSMKRFQEVIEEEFANFFNAERAMIVFVNRYQKWTYRVIYDSDNKEFKMKTFPFEYGIAGYVAFSGLTIFVDSVADDIRFAKDLDDPRGLNTE